MKKNKKFSNKINSLIKTKDYSMVIKLCKKNIASNLLLRESYSFLARAYTETDQLAASLSTCDTYLSLGKNNKLILKEKAYLLYKQEKYGKAIEFALMVKNDKSKDIDLQELLAKSYLANKDYHKSLEVYQELQKNVKANKEPYYYYLALCLQELGKEKEAFNLYVKQLQYDNNDSRTMLKFAPLADKAGSWKYAIVGYQKLLETMPAHKDKLNMAIGGCHLNLADVETAVDFFRSVPACEWLNHCGTLLAYHYDQKYNPEFIYKEHFLWALQHPVTDYKPTKRQDSIKINIGFISPDFRNHPVTYFLMPIIEHLDREKFEIFCFSNVLNESSLTKEIKERSDLSYIDIRNLDISKIAEVIKEKKIDILIDLAGHTASSRLGVMARKAAPVQMTYLGYPDTTGLRQIDYRISDFYADPPKLTDPYCSEQLLRLPNCFLSFEPPSYCPEVSELPYKKNGFITFGSFNKVTKISHHAIVLWAFVLKRIPNSRLVLKSRGLEGDVGEIIIARFEAQGIDSNRIKILPLSVSHEGHFSQYSEIDIALDSYPYNGTTTTFEALWMGRPVISRAGDNHVSRVSSSILQNSNMSELVVESDVEYINVAEKLVNNLELLEKVSRTLRPRMMKLGLVDSKLFVNDFEIALQKTLFAYDLKFQNNWHGERIYHPCGFQLFIRNNYIPELTRFQYDYCLFLEKTLRAGTGCLDIGFFDIESSLTIAQGLGETGRYLVIEDDTEITDYILENVNGNLLNNTSCSPTLDRQEVNEHFIYGCNVIRINASQYFAEIFEEIFSLISLHKPIIQLNLKPLQVDINNIIVAFNESGYKPFILLGKEMISVDKREKLLEEDFIFFKQM